MIVLERLLSAIARMLKEPRLKIVGFSKVVHNEDSEGEFIDLYFTVKNTGGDRAEDCEIRAKVKSISKDFYYVTHMPFSLNAGIDTKIYFQQIIKNEQRTRSLSKNSPILEIGKIYEYEIRFSGVNFKDEKKHKLKLDLSSWENIEVILDC